MGKTLIRNQKEFEKKKEGFKHKIEFSEGIANDKPKEYPCVLIDTWIYSDCYYLLSFVYLSDFNCT